MTNHPHRSRKIRQVTVIETARAEAGACLAGEIDAWKFETAAGLARISKEACSRVGRDGSYNMRVRLVGNTEHQGQLHLAVLCALNADTWELIIGPAAFSTIPQFAGER